jgi:NAD(P)-dependent dehydrogenase (short-subunit alcohol dehydrogenase family)
MPREVGEAKICVNAVAPGLTSSAGVVENGHWSDERIDRNAPRRALKHRTIPKNLVGSGLFLASCDANFVTGQTKAIDDGAVAH